MKDLSKVMKNLMIHDPYYSLFLISTKKLYSTHVPTAAVSLDGINPILEINPKFWDDLSLDHKYGILKHELLHIIFQHILITTKEAPNKTARQFAADLVVNQYISEKLLPGNPILISNPIFTPLNLLPFKGFKYYYNELDKEMKRNSSFSLTLDSSNFSISNDWENIEDLLEVIKVDPQVIKALIEHTTIEVYKSIGSHPAELKEIINNLLSPKPPSFNWKAFLRTFSEIGPVINIRYTKKKPSKRFKGNPGIKIVRKKNILVAVDTSGSISVGELSEFFSEIYHIWKVGCNITILECDTKISSTYQYTGKFRGYITGRGGTIFDEPVKFYNDNISKYSSLIFFTDGYGHLNVTPKNIARILWVLSSNGKNEKLPGKTIKISLNEHK